ncbi:CheW domain-containing protein [Leptolyngbya sp. NK1-12]|uniref:CheW domain-containing protein n=1 Tax=Leptolyngbya sp. NK1-12 TaxID=2547451 RepID=A0AA97AIF3_9CYAN|nr:CheW domain-containing protein [Leptolyngbya sp. NK1-12]WNZ23776.1 CheW domain-containing protein [Leptolyngbya sp. NK1-12]
MSIRSGLPPSVNHTVNPQTGEQFLRCCLAPDALVMLPVAQLTEVLRIPIEQITPIPHLPAWVMGVYNWRGEVLWMVDLGHLLGFEPWHQRSVSPLYTAAVLHADFSDQRLGVNHELGEDRQMLGLVVTQVQEIEWCDPGQLQSPSPSAVTPELAPFLRGYWLKPTGEVLASLDGNALLAAMPKA